MPRPFCFRRVGQAPAASIFKPIGIPVTELEEVVMTLDEFEALRLSDLDGLYQEKVAGRMQVSRPTVGRILDSARRKVADALVNGKALRIEGGPVNFLGKGKGRGRCRRRGRRCPMADAKTAREEKPK